MSDANASSNTIKDPDDWVTGDEPMTGAQASYLETLASEAGEDVPDDLTKADASKKIDELQDKSDRLTSPRAPLRSRRLRGPAVPTIVGTRKA
jgi:hypothetical protein